MSSGCANEIVEVTGSGAQGLVVAGDLNAIGPDRARLAATGLAEPFAKQS
jgi:hypothetical protein